MKRKAAPTLPTQLPEPAREHLAALYGEAEAARQRVQEALDLVSKSLGLEHCHINLESGAITPNVP